VKAETDKWRGIAAFFARFEQDVQLATPRAARNCAAELAPWVGRPVAGQEPRVEFSRSSTVDGVDAPRRTGYRLNEKREIELWLWPALDAIPAQPPLRYPVLSEVAEFDLRYLAADSAWIEAWPRPGVDPPIPRAVRLRVVLGSGEEIQRVFALSP
jgi:general secretion pathway protein J